MWIEPKRKMSGINSAAEARAHLLLGPRLLQVTQLMIEQAPRVVARAPGPTSDPVDGILIVGDSE